jgi:hypothetical protein
LPANTPRGYPYPLPTEPVAEGAQAIRNLAERIDSNSALELIETKTLSAPGHLIFSAIPQIYTDLEVRLFGRADAGASGLTEIVCQFNDYGAAGYNSQRLLWYQAAVTANELAPYGAASIGYCPDTAGDASLRCAGRATFPGYRSAGWREWMADIHSGGPGGGGRRTMCSGLCWGLGAGVAITKLDFWLNPGGNFAVGSRATLYGVK